jgi:hypothetical protein
MAPAMPRTNVIVILTFASIMALANGGCTSNSFIHTLENSTTYACSISAGSSLTVHVVANGRAVAGATILLNGTYFCNGQPYASKLSATTDDNGTASFSVVPGANYNMTVIPPPSLVGASIVAAQIQAPPPTIFTTTTISVPVQSSSTRPPAQSYEPFLDIFLASLMLPGIGILAIRSKKQALYS